MGKAFWRILRLLIEMGADLDEWLDDGAEYAARQMIDFMRGVVPAWDCDLIPGQRLWKQVRRTCRIVGRYVGEHGGSPTEEWLREQLG